MADFKSTNKDAENLIKNLEKMKSLLKEMDSDTAFKKSLSLVNKDDYKEIEKLTSYAEKKFSKVRDEMHKMGSNIGNYDKKANTLGSKAPTSLQATQSSGNSLNASVGGFGGKSITDFNKYSSEFIKNIDNAIKDIQKTPVLDYSTEDAKEKERNKRFKNTKPKSSATETETKKQQIQKPVNETKSVEKPITMDFMAQIKKAMANVQSNVQKVNNIPNTVAKNTTTNLNSKKEYSDADIKKLLEDYKTLEKATTLANKTGVGDATALKDKYSELKKRASDINAFSNKNLGKDADFATMFNARLGKNIGDFYGKVKTEADKAGISVKELNDTMLKNAGVDTSKNDGSIKSISEISKVAEKAHENIAKLNSSVAGKGGSGGTNKDAEAMFKGKYQAITNHVSDYETMNNTKMPLTDQVEYYKSAVQQFERGSREYIGVLALQRRAEQGLADESAKVTQQLASTKAKELADAERQVAHENDLTNQRLKIVQNYVSNTEALTGKKMSYKDQASYYDGQLGNFTYGSQQYMDVLKLKQRAEENARASTERNAKATISIIANLGSAITNTVNKIIGIIRNVVKFVSTSVNAIIKSVKFVKDALTSILTLHNSFGNRVSAFDPFKVLSRSATELRSKIMLVKGAFNTLFNNNYNKQAMSLFQSVYSMKNIMGGQLTQDTIDWAKSMEYAFGLSAKELIADMNELTGVLYGLGMKAQDVSTGSKNILMVGRYLAFMGAAGGDTTTVISKLVSGMKGMTQSIDDLGLSVREAQMDSYLKSLKAQGGEYANIGTSFAGLNEEARVYVRYSSLIQQFTSKYAMEDFTKSLDTVTGRISVLKQTMWSFGTTIGQVFVKLLSGVAPYIMTMIGYLQAKILQFVSWIGALFGVDLATDMWSGMNDGVGLTDDLNSSLEDTNKELEDADANAKKLKGSLAGFDRIESIDTSSSSSSSNSGKGSFDYSTLMADSLAKMNEMALNANQSYLDGINKQVTDNLGKMRKNVDGWIRDVSGRATFDVEFDSESASTSLSSILQNLKTTFKESSLTVIGISLKIADDVNIGKILNKVLELGVAISELMATLSTGLKPILFELYETYMKPFVETLGVKIVEILDSWITNIQELTKWIGIDENLKAIVETLFKIGDENTKIKFDEFATAHPVIANLVEIVSSLLSIIKSLWGVVKPLLAELLEWAKEDFLPWLNENLKVLADWISSNKETIAEFIKYIADLAWNLAEYLIPKLVELVGYIIEHPKELIIFFETLIALKVAGWALSTASSLGFLITGLKGLSGALPVLAGVAPVVGGVGGAVVGGVAVADGIGDVVDGAKMENGKEAQDKIMSGGVKTSAVVAGAGVGAIVGSVVPGIGTAIGAGIGAGIGGAVALFKGDEIGKFFSDVVDDVRNWSTKTGESIGNWYSTTKETVTNWGAETGQKISEWYSGTKETVTNWGAETGEKIGEWYNNTKETVTNWGAETGEKIAEWYTGSKEKVGNFATESGQDISNWATNTKESFSSWCSGIVEKVGQWGGDMLTKAGEVFTNVKNKIAEVCGPIVDDFNKIKDGVVEKVGILKDKAVEKFTELKGKVGEVLGPLKDDIVEKFTKAKDDAVKIWENVKTDFSNITKNIQDSFKGAIDNIKGYFTGLKEKVGEVIDGIGEKIGDMWDGAKDFVGNVSAKFTGGVTTANAKASVKAVPNIGAYAGGGSINGGQLFIANENGKAELVGNFGTGRTSVANNEMITDAMNKAVFEGTFNALAEMHNATGGSNNTGNVTIKVAEGGFAVVDESTLRQLAMMLAPHMYSNSINVANVGF